MPPDPATPRPRPQRSSLFHSVAFAIAGIRAVVRTERNFRIHVVAAVAALSFGVILGLSTAELAILLLTITLVLTAELMNTAIEAAVDLASPEVHPLAQRAKDVAAGAVLASAAGAVGVGLLLFLPRLLTLR